MSAERSEMADNAIPPPPQPADITDARNERFRPRVRLSKQLKHKNIILTSNKHFRQGHTCSGECDTREGNAQVFDVNRAAHSARETKNTSSQDGFAHNENAINNGVTVDDTFNALQDEATSESSDSAESNAENIDDDLYFQVAAATPTPGEKPVEEDIIRKRCADLRLCLRDRPCLPLNKDNEPLSGEDLAKGIQLPMYSCPWKDCTFCSNDRTFFLHHVAGGVRDTTHRRIATYLQNRYPVDV